MANPGPAPVSEIVDQAVRAGIERRLAAGIPGAWLLAALAHAPRQAAALEAALTAVAEGGLLPPRLKLLVQLQLSRRAGDRYFQAGLAGLLDRGHGLGTAALDEILADYDEDSRLDDRERLALRYAEQIYLDSSKIDDDFYTDLRGLFTEAEIIELASILALCHGVYRVTAALGVSAGADAELRTPLRSPSLSHPPT